MNSTPQIGYIDADFAYLLGLITERGKLSELGGVRQISIEFPYQLLEVQGIEKKFNTSISIRLGLQAIRERILNLTDADITIINKETDITLMLRFLRNTMIWRNIQVHLQGKTSYEYFSVPNIFFSDNIPRDWKREYIKEFADVAGNVRRSNRYADGANRVRLDILNYPTNWEMPVQICTLLEEHLDIPVQLVTWGHPNLGRDFREHQINIFAIPFGNIGFSLEHKQGILEEFIEHDKRDFPAKLYNPCLGRKRVRNRKLKSKRENDERLDERIKGQHFNSYWQICKKLGCPRTPKVIQQSLWEFDEQDSLEEELEDEI